MIQDPLFTGLRPAEMTPAERAAAVAALLSVGRLRRLRPEHFPPPATTRTAPEVAGGSG